MIARGDLMEIVDPIWAGSDFYNGPTEYTSSLTPFTKEQIWVWAVLWYDREVSNGGHDQFFGNSTGMVWPEALEGLTVVGLNSIEKILLEAVGRFEVMPSRVRTSREAQLDRTAGFDDLDEAYFALTKSIDLSDHILAYIRSNPTPFYFDDDVTTPD